MTIQGADLVAVFSGGWLEQITTPTAPSVSGTATEFDNETLDAMEEVLEEIYTDVSFWIYGSASYDPTTGKNTTGDATEYEKHVIPPFNAELRYVDGDVIRRGDLFTGVAGKDIEFTPEEGISVTIGDDIWVVMAVQPIISGNRTPLYLLQLRK